jgi:hypothetical protein
MSLLNRTTLSWVDAYTLFNISIAEAKNNRIMRSEVNESTKRAEREALRLGTQQAIAVAANQRLIQQQMAFDPEGHKEYMRIWKNASLTLLAMDWDLANEEVHFQEEGKGGSIRFWQGEDPTKRTCLLPRVEAALVIRFLRWIQQNSAVATFDPREHVRKMLTKQGITKQNFHLHADKLAVTNPWLDV